MRAKLEGLIAIHSARRAYAPGGIYSAGDAGDRSMTIRTSPDAEATQHHPLIRAHPETGRLGLFSCFGYIIGIDGLADDEALPLLIELYHRQGREEFQYRHRWQKDMLVMWDNQSVLHAATSGYAGHHRLLHRTTIAGV